MPQFTIETTYRLPVYRHRTYEADTLDQVCQLAVEDDDWSDEKSDTDSSGETYVSGAWQGAGTAYAGSALPIPPQFAETIQRKADHFEMLLGVLKILAHVEDLGAADLPLWLPRAQAAVAKAEAILAGKPDPDAESAGVVGRVHMLMQLEEGRVRAEIASIIEIDPAPRVTTDVITDADIHAACLAVAASTNLSEEQGAAQFRAALAAIREAERRLGISA
jgi:hypothetical protein